MIRKIFRAVGAFIALVLFLSLAVYAVQEYQYFTNQLVKKEKYLDNSSNTIPHFSTPIEIAYHRFLDSGTSMPFLDITFMFPYGDHRQAVFLTGGEDQFNQVLVYSDGVFQDITQELNLQGIKGEAAYSVAIGDINKDGLDDVVLGYASGIYVSYSQGNRFLDPEKIGEIPDACIPHDIALCDAQNRGFLDIFVCTFVDRKHFTSATYHDLSNKRQNVWLVNNEDGTFTESAKESGLYLIENSYLAEFVDIDSDGFQDLVLASNTNRGKVYENRGDGTFTVHDLPVEYGFWMGLAVDKLTDTSEAYHILMSNIGKSLPVPLIRGDLKKDEVFDPNYAFLKQVDGFQFENVTDATCLYSNKFGWGVLFADVNNDGRKDAFVAENYIKFPGSLHHVLPSAGKGFLQNTDGSFAEFQEEMGLLNSDFGYRLLSADITGNGYQDILIANIDGALLFFKNIGVSKDAL